MTTVRAPSLFASTPPALCEVDPACFWPWLTSPTIAGWSRPEETVVVIPMAGTADWGLGHPLDAEETVLMHVLKVACESLQAAEKPLVVPPLRFVVGADPGCAFAVDPQATHALVAEVVSSVAAAGFRKIVLLNASPWNEEICGAAARDLRVSKGLHMFQIHLSALGLDFHPVRSKTRRDVQTLLTALCGAVPEETTPEAPAPRAWGDETVRALPGPSLPLEAAAAEGGRIAASVGAQLAGLLSDIRRRAPLTAKITPV